MGAALADVVFVVLDLIFFQLSKRVGFFAEYRKVETVTEYMNTTMSGYLFKYLLCLEGTKYRFALGRKSAIRRLKMVW